MPVGFSAITEGLPGPARLAGFALAFTGIWLVTGSTTVGEKVSRQGLLLACVAGAGFGGFFILLGQVEPGKVFTPLLIARGVALASALLMIRVYRLALPALTSNPTALLAGLLDAGATFSPVGPAVRSTGCGGGAGVALPGLDRDPGTPHPR
jgi:threonine/homoserine efflux transporter RhtA